MYSANCPQINAETNKKNNDKAVEDLFTFDLIIPSLKLAFIWLFLSDESIGSIKRRPRTETISK